MSSKPPSPNHMDQHPENKGDLVRYDLRFDSYSLAINSEGRQQIQFCPWCGERLPPSQRGRWFDELEVLGIDPMNEPYPDRYSTDHWRR
jgi:hypothetical protein